MRRLRRRGRHAHGLVVALEAGEVNTVRGALADGAEFRRSRAAQWCEACQVSPLGACGDHVADLEQANVYDELAADLAAAARLRR